MDDRNIVRAVLFSAAVNILIEEGRALKIITGTADFEAIKKYEKTILERAGSMVDDMVDAADIHDEDCDCEEDEEEVESNGSELSLEDMGEFLRAAARGALKAQLGGICRACGEAVKGKDKMVAHLATCGAIKNKRERN